MSNTFGTIIRVLFLLTCLVGGWFFTVTALYALATMALGISFSWAYASIAFGLVVLVRMFYPRNVFLEEGSKFKHAN